MKNNRIVLDLNKCQYAWRSWVTACGNYKRAEKPTGPTVHGQEFDVQSVAFPYIPSSFFLNDETMLERAKRVGILDTWIPCVTFQLTANHRLTYTGDKAEAMWKAWCERIFYKGKQSKKKV